jgi:cysteine desulfurase
MKRTYLDWNASAPVRPEAREALLAALDRFGNPSSIHAEGRAARDLLETSREEVAAFMGCRPAEIVFTSGGCESNNLAVASLAASAEERSFAGARIEHGSVLSRLDGLAENGWQPRWLPVTREGRVETDGLVARVGFATLQAANQETGALQPVASLGERCGELGVDWHCDAVQAWGKTTLRVDRLGCATASLSGHKLGAPKGTGALFVREGTPVAPLLLGGPQERGRRAGTENVPALAALAAACRAAAGELEELPRRVGALRDRLVEEVREICPTVKINGPSDNALRVPTLASFSFPGLEGALLVQAMDIEGVAVSAGSACASGAVKPSPVLLAMGLDEPCARGVLRVSLGRSTTEADVEYFAEALSRVLARMPAVAGS